MENAAEERGFLRGAVALGFLLEHGEGVDEVFGLIRAAFDAIGERVGGFAEGDECLGGKGGDEEGEGGGREGEFARRGGGLFGRGGFTGGSGSVGNGSVRSGSGGSG